MKLKSFGCSFVFGTDLLDARPQGGPENKASENTWPALLAKKLNYEYKCYAQGGAGNLCILNRILNQINHEPFFCVVNWTYIDRFDFRDLEGGPTGLNDWIQIRPGCDDAVAKFYFSTLHSEYRDKIVSLMAIYTAIQILLENRCPFIMTSMDDLLFDTQFKTETGVKLLQDNIRSFIKTFEGENFLSWSISKSYAISEQGHPLEDAHLAAANYIFDQYVINQQGLLNVS